LSLNAQDWQKLRIPVIGLAAALILVGLLVSFADQYRNKNEIALQTQQNLLRQAQQKLQLSGQEKETIIQYLPVYNDLLAKGFIGEERRIEWIEALRQIHAQNKLFSIDYQIGQQENYRPNFLPNLGNFVLHKSTMQLTLDLLHEGDMLTVLDGLRQQSTPFIVRDCQINRPVNAPINTQNLSTNMQAHCAIDWLSLRDPQLANTANAGAI
jgi:type II secretory pathway pseudopilin PulG